MAFRVLNWVSDRIGLDITGEQEFQKNQKVEDDNGKPTTTNAILHQQNPQHGTAAASSSAAPAATAVAVQQNNPTQQRPAQGYGVPPAAGAGPRGPTTTVTVTSTSHPAAAAEAARTEHRLEELQRELNTLQDARAQVQRSGEGPSKRPKFVQLMPTKLYFPLPLDKYIMNTLTITNITSSWVSFKIKATAPVRYAVKPRMAVLQPNDSAEIHITLRPTEEDPADLHDKFLIESRPLTQEELNYYHRTADLQTLWQQRKEAAATKIQCRFTSTLPANFIVKSLAEQNAEDDEAPVYDDDEEGEILPAHPMPTVSRARRVGGRATDL